MHVPALQICCLYCASRPTLCYNQLGRAQIQTVDTQGLCQVAPQGGSNTSLLGLASNYAQGRNFIWFFCYVETFCNSRTMVTTSAGNSARLLVSCNQVLDCGSCTVFMQSADKVLSMSASVLCVFCWSRFTQICNFSICVTSGADSWHTSRAGHSGDAVPSTERKALCTVARQQGPDVFHMGSMALSGLLPNYAVLSKLLTSALQKANVKGILLTDSFSTSRKFCCKYGSDALFTCLVQDRHTDGLWWARNNCM